MLSTYLVGRILVGLYYIYSGFNHFRALEMMAGYSASKGIPAPKLAVAASGVLLFVGGFCILLGFQPVVGVAAIVLFLIPVTFTMHRYWDVEDPMQRMGEAVNFNKNIALLGSTLMFLAIPRPWPYSIWP
jgi:putative oxidoreductase